MKKRSIILTILAIIYFAVTPLIYSSEPVLFHKYKLISIYVSIGLILLVTIFSWKEFTEERKLAKTTFRTERIIFFVIAFILFLAFLQNMNSMSTYVLAGYMPLGLFFGAGPNNLSVFFYFLCMVGVSTGVLIMSKINIKLVRVIIYISIVIVGLIIMIQMFETDFIGYGRSFLYGFGNSNYAPDAFAVLGILVLIPLFYRKSFYVSSMLGIFFFIVVLLTRSRAAFLGIIVATMFAGIYLIGTKKLKVTRTIFILVSGLSVVVLAVFLANQLGYSALWKEFSKVIDVMRGAESITNADSYRFELWTYTINKAFSTPMNIIFGMSMAVFPVFDGSITYLATNVHNQYLDVLISGGIFVFAMFIYLLVKQFIYAWKITKYDINNLPLMSALIFIYVKWIFNSLNALHSPFVLLVFILISSRYMHMKAEVE